MEKIDVSIIVPLYKGQRYVPRLQRLFEQNILYGSMYKKCSIEVIYINDYPNEKIDLGCGSVYYDSFVIQHQENKGIHASRVDGIKNSNGDYIIMFDQDDIAKESWLYSQWRHIIDVHGSYCICNGWLSRFKPISMVMKEYGKKVNDIMYYLVEGNPIVSPGQVIVKKSDIPLEWIENIMQHNGADDFLLWILALKQGYEFTVNEEYLYYHTPERTKDSIDNDKMKRSVQEVGDILNNLNKLDKKEANIWKNKVLKYTLPNDTVQLYERTKKINSILCRWVKLQIFGMNLSYFFENKNIESIAIYGIGTLGEFLYRELKAEGFQVKYGIDKSAMDFENEFPIYRLNDDLQFVEAVVVTILFNVSPEEIKILRNKLNCEVVYLEEMLEELEYKMYSRDITL